MHSHATEIARGKSLAVPQHAVLQPMFSYIRGHSLLMGKGHDGCVNCVRATTRKSVSEPKTFVAVNAIYSHKFAGHDTFASTFVATY